MGYKKELPTLLSFMLEHSWYPDFDLPIADMAGLESAAKGRDIAVIDKFLIDYYAKSIHRVEARLVERYPARRHVVDAGFRAFEQHQFLLCIPVFLSQADRISEEILAKQHFFRFKASLPEAKKLMLDGRISDYGQILLDPLLQAGTVREHTTKLLGKTDFLNRHAVLHGIEPDYGSQKNALKAISLLAYLSSVDEHRPR